MKIDTYTKTILTIIAICLTINVLKDFDIFPSAYAAEKIEYKPTNEVMDVRLVDINTYDELNVNLKSVDTYDELKVNIKKIETTDKLDVNLDEIGGGWVSNGGPIPVKVH
ncbi:hypothetical protein [Aequorivita sp. CIP111184]|uniref:hypothetical protein n=1 Tax=Aequorivita sp. CIP111184 TaxID=2211356 RepID=UPI000DBC1741|nr:hypothetical protein [Aequorivita sp. CIP111184]SRX55004.1 hypothetical protein AEQU1_02024 [Aequorivita sp. CIP111184]